jgi:hypothetical protein
MKPAAKGNCYVSLKNSIRKYYLALFRTSATASRGSNAWHPNCSPTEPKSRTVERHQKVCAAINGSFNDHVIVRVGQQRAPKEAGLERLVTLA